MGMKLSVIAGDRCQHGVSWKLIDHPARGVELDCPTCVLDEMQKHLPELNEPEDEGEGEPEDDRNKLVDSLIGVG